MTQLIADNTLLSDMVCDTRAALRHVLGYTTKVESAALKCGVCGHHALAAFLLCRKGDPVKVAMRAFERTYKKWADKNVDPNDRLAYHNASRCMHAWFKDHPVDKLPFTIKRKYVEYPVQMDLGVVEGVDILFVGIFDAAGLSRKGSGLWIIDHKTTRACNQWWKDAQRTTAQFTGYIVIGQHEFGKPIAGVFVNGVGIPMLNSSSKACPKHKVPYHECATAPEHLHHEIMPVTRNPNQITSWKDTALALTRDYMDLRDGIDKIQDIQYCLQQGTFRYRCNNCDFKEFCDRGRTLHAAKMLLIHEPWNPIEHAEKRQQFADEIHEEWGD